MMTPREWARECSRRIDLNCPEVSASEIVEVIVGEAVAAERERCAKLLRTKADHFYHLGERDSDPDLSRAYRNHASALRDAAGYVESVPA